MKKYLVIGGYVRSRTDGDNHYVNAIKLVRLYNLPWEECILTEEEDEDRDRRPFWDGLITLRPRYSGNYTL